MQPTDTVFNLAYRHGLLLDALRKIAKEQILRETWSGNIVLTATPCAIVALRAIEVDESYGEGAPT